MESISLSTRQFKAEIMAKLLASTINQNDLATAATAITPDMQDAIAGASRIANAIIAQAKIRDERT